MECSGLLTNAGTMDLDGGLIYAADYYLYSSYTSESGLIGMVMTGATTFDFGDGEFTHGTFMINSAGTCTMENDQTMANLLVGAGTLSLGSDRDHSVTGVTVATGGTLNGTDSTLTCSGDFTTAGGLIGKSALDFDATERVTITENFDGIATTDEFTLECWAKGDTESAAETLVVRGSDWSTGTCQLYFNADGYLRLAIYFDDGGEEISYDTDTRDGKWHNYVGTFDGTDLKIYVDGKLVLSTPRVNGPNIPTQTNGAFLGARGASTPIFTGQMGRASIWDTALTPAQIRTMMFQNFTEATTTNCLAWYQFDSGTGTDILDSSSNSFDGTYDGDWAGAGTFTYGTSTLVFSKSGTQTINYLKDETFNKMTINSGSTTNLFGVDETTAELRVIDDLNISGTLASTASEYINFTTDFTDNSGTITIGGTVSGMYKFRTQHTSGTVTFPACTTPRIICDGSGGTTTAGGDLTITTELEVNSGATFKPNGNTTTSKLVDLNGTATLNLLNSTLILSHTSGLTSESGVTLVGGPGTTISGSSAATTFESQNNWSVVGKCENLDVITEELKVTGQVINCTGYIIQQHPSIDADQQLDYDTADDRDIQFGVPDLDKNTELVT